jgi:hypothetical protein
LIEEIQEASQRGGYQIGVIAALIPNRMDNEAIDVSGL